MSKYGEALGIWELTIGNADLKIRPRKGDNLELMNILKRNKNDEDAFFDAIYSFLIKIIGRDVPPNDDKEKDELCEYVEFNLMELFKEMMVKFRWSTKEQMNKLVSDASKKES
jgi:hypothetical protein